MALRTTEDSIVFACWSAACAPPPAGRGGSIKGGRKGGSVIRKSGGGDSSIKAGTSKSIAKAITNRYSTKDGMEVGKGTKLRPGSAPKNSRRGRYGATGNSKTAVAKNRPGGVGGSSVGKAAKAAVKPRVAKQQDRHKDLTKGQDERRYTSKASAQRVAKKEGKAVRVLSYKIGGKRAYSLKNA